MIVDLGKSRRSVSRVTSPQTFYGLCFAPDGKTLYASGGEYEVVHAFDFADGFLATAATASRSRRRASSSPAAWPIDADGQDALRRRHLGPRRRHRAARRSPKERDTDPARQGQLSLHLPPDAGGKRLFVSLWNKAARRRHRPGDRRSSRTWPTEKHPTEMALVPGRQDALRRLRQLDAG